MSWNIEDYVISNNTYWYVNIDTIDGDLKAKIDQYIVEICYADSFLTVQEVKLEIQNFLNNELSKKADKSEFIKRKQGAIAEFLIHVFMKTHGFNQECLFFNLEERSLKKGFDGVYTDENDLLWYMESKSGSNKSFNHKDKVEEAYRDLNNKFVGKTTNNPWKNALNHAKIVGSNETILDQFRQYTKEYIKKVSHNIEDYNVIPCGTLYLDDQSKSYDPKMIFESINNYFLKKNQKGLCVICLTQQSIDEFEKYLAA